MKKAEMITKVAEATGQSKKETQATIEAFAKELKKLIVEGDSFGIVGLGTFGRKLRKAKSGVTKLGGQEKSWSIPAQYVPKFKASKQFTEEMKHIVVE